MPATTSTAPELTAEVVQRILLQPLADSSVILSAPGLRTFDTSGGNSVRIPKFGTMTAPSWHGEGETINEVEATFDEIELLPSTMKSVKSLTRFSNELARQSVVDITTALQARMVKDVRNKIDNAFISGDGTIVSGHQTTPLGILNFAGTQQIASVGTLALDHLHDAVGLALAADVDTSALRWLIRPETFTKLRKIKDGSQRYQLTPDPTTAGGFTLLGHPVTVTKRLPATTGGTPTTSAVLWDASQVAVARDLDASVKILDQTFAASDQQAIRVVMRLDIGALNPEAVIVLRAITL